MPNQLNFIDACTPGSEKTKQRLSECFADKRWIFAKTMPQNPHCYTLRREWQDNRLFDWAVKAIRAVGYREYYAGRPYTVVYLQGMKYWTMGAPVPQTILINRKDSESA